MADVAGLHAEFVAEGIAATELRRGTPYGVDDFDVVDPDGQRIAFGQDVDPDPGPGLSANRGRGG